MTAKPTTWARTPISSMIYRYDRADEFMEVVLGHWDTWEDGSLIMDKKTGRFADPAKVKRLDHKGEFLQVARAVHRAALAAGPSRHHPGRRLRPRPALCRTMGRGDLHRRAQSRRRQGRLCRGPQRGGEGRPRSRPDAPLQPHHAGLRRDQGGGRGQDGADQQAAAGDRRAVAAGGSAELRFRLQGRSTSR